MALTSPDLAKNSKVSGVSTKGNTIDSLFDNTKYLTSFGKNVFDFFLSSNASLADTNL